MSISDLFKYAIAHGLYTASPTSPVSSLFMQTNSERLAKAEPYKPFTDDDLKKMFESEGLQGRHGEPDLHWRPLIGLYSGMRISEAMGIYCEDVQTAENDVAFIHVANRRRGRACATCPSPRPCSTWAFWPSSTSSAMPATSGSFPDRPLINESYSKELGKRFRDYLMERGVRAKGDKSERKSFTASGSTW